MLFICLPWIIFACRLFQCYNIMLTVARSAYIYSYIFSLTQIFSRLDTSIRLLLETYDAINKINMYTWWLINLSVCINESIPVFILFLITFQIISSHLIDKHDIINAQVLLNITVWITTVFGHHSLMKETFSLCKYSYIQ
jgi:hypothetical protein